MIWEYENILDTCHNLVHNVTIETGDPDIFFMGILVILKGKQETKQMVNTIYQTLLFCNITWGLLKPGIGWDRPGTAGTRFRVLAFGTFGSRVPGFDVIAITDLICFSPLAMNDRERMCIGLAGIIDLLQSIYKNFIFRIVK